jgi:hypothetical protein
VLNFTTRREEHTLSRVEVGHTRIPADDRNESKSNTPEFLVEVCCVKCKMYSVASPELTAIARRKGRYCLGTAATGRYAHPPSDNSTLQRESTE